MKIIYSLLLAFMATVTFAQPTSEINGRVYIDVNTNGSFDAGDYPLVSHLVTMQPGNQVGITDAAGQYILPATSGVAYKIKPTQLTAMNAVLDSVMATVPLSDTLLTGVDFAFTITNLQSDVKVYITEVITGIQSQILAYNIKLVNSGTRTENGQVAFYHPGIMSFDSASPVQTTVVGDTVKWAFSTLVPGSERFYTVWLQADAGSNNAVYQVKTTATISNTDVAPLNNTAKFDSKIVQDYPRNRKTVFPLSYNAVNLAAGEYVDYLIQFQNRGDAMAAKAWIIDTLDAGFDMSTLYVVGASHNYRLTITGNVLRVDFDTINIPNHTADEILSHGFFRFMIKPTANNTLTGIIRNKAYIYFSNGYVEEVGCGMNICISTLNMFTTDGNVTTLNCNAVPGYANAFATSTVNMYDYEWSDGSTGSSQLMTYTPGTYYVTATDVCGTTATGPAFIGTIENTDLGATIELIENPCGGGVDSFKATTCNGVPPFTYLWSTGSTAQAIAVQAGNFYSCTVTDADGITAENSGDYTGPSGMTDPPVQASATNDACAGTATINASGGDGWYTYQWSNGDTDFYTTDDPGVYYFTVTDGIGCADTGSISLENASALNAAVIYAVPPDCGGDGYGKIYYFLPFGVQAFIFGSTTPYIGEGSIDNVLPGDYSFLIDFIEPQECYITQEVHVEAAEEFQLSVSQASPASCTANNGKLTLSVTANANLSYAILWSNGWQGLNNDNLAAGTYTVTVTFSNQCVSTATGTISQTVSNTQVNVNMQPVTCYGGNNGSASVTPFGGSFSYNYAWSTGAQTQTISNLTAGNYIYTVTENNGCTVTGSVLVTQPPALNLALTATDASCGAANGSITATASGGTAPYIYTWPSGNNGSQLAAGTYTVTVQDGCMATATAIVTVNTATQGGPLTVSITQADLTCYQVNSGTINVDACGGSGSYTYTWNHGGQGPNLTGLAANTYTVHVNDGTTTITRVITIAEPAEITFGLTTQCNGTSGAQVQGLQGGTGNYTYAWSTGGSSASITGVANGNYSVTVSDGTSCSSSATVQVTSIDNLGFPAVDYTEGLCGANGTVAVSGMGNPAFVWATFDSTDVDGAGETFSVEYDTYYNLSVGYADVQGLCFKDTLIYIPQAGPGLDIDLTNLQNPVCNGEQNGSIAVGASGGTPPYTCLWSNGSNGSTLSNLQSGEIITTVTDANGCTAVDSFTLAQPAAITLSVTTTDASCYGTPTGLIQLNVSGGAGGYTYAWSDTTIQPGGIPAGTYSVTITDANGCSLTTSQTITEPVELTGATVATDESVCGAADGSITVSVAGGVAGYTYLWNNTQTGATANGLLAGTYTVTVTDANGCSVVYQSEVDCVTGIGAQPALKIALYPNPAEDMVYIDVPAGDNYDVTMYDMTGRVIMQLNISQHTQVSLVDIAKGMYTIEVKAADQNISRVEKLVVR